MLQMMIRLTDIPAYQPALRFLPIVSIRNPVVVFRIIHQSEAEIAMAMKNPKGRPRMSGIRADSSIFGVRVMGWSGSLKGVLAK